MTTRQHDAGGGGGGDDDALYMEKRSFLPSGYRAPPVCAAAYGTRESDLRPPLSVVSCRVVAWHVMHMLAQSSYDATERVTAFCSIQYQQLGAH
jgi:hypothetical protein